MTTCLGKKLFIRFTIMDVFRNVHQFVPVVCASLPFGFEGRVCNFTV